MDWLGQLTSYSIFASRTLVWWFIPNLVTRAALQAYYTLLVPIGLPHLIPPSDSPKRQQHFRRAFSVVVLSYLSWNLVQNLLEQPSSFYSLLGVNVNATDAEIKTAYRNFAKRYHPDRVGPAGEALFIQVRDAYEALKLPIKRYGYDRFGFEALEWKVAENPHAMLWQGLESAIRYYLPTGAIMLGMAVMGWGGASSYWRHITWALVATLEACIIIGYNPLGPYAHLSRRIFCPLAFLVAKVGPDLSLVPSMAPYQWTFFLRETFVSLAIALGVVVPVVFPPPPTKREVQVRQAEIARLAIGLDTVVREIIVQSALSDVQAKELVQREIQYLDMRDISPSLPNEICLSESHRVALAALAPAMQRLVVQHTLLDDVNIRALFLEALDRTSDKLKQEGEDARDVKTHVMFTGIGRNQLTPEPDYIRALSLSSGSEELTTARILAIPSPPSSTFAPSRDATPEPSFTPGFDANTPGFNWSPSPVVTPTTSRVPVISDNRTASFVGASTIAKGTRRPSLSPSKRPSKLSEVGLVSPMSPVTVKEEPA